ncbi:hypothetical protein [Acetonema longum]|nr:hypothetical protein [Acetonema longum]
MKQNRKEYLIFVLLVVIAAGVLVSTVMQTSQSMSESMNKENELKNMFHSIKPPPGAVLKDVESIHKTTSASAGGKYITQLTYDEIRTYYDNELKKAGWTFLKEEPLRDWGKEFGGRTIQYKKEDYFLDLDYYGSREKEFGFTYELYISWGVYLFSSIERIDV